MADDFGLLVDFLRHEVAMVALIDHERRSVGLEDRTLDLAAGGVMHFDGFARQHNRVAVLEVGNRIGERCERDGVGAEIHLAVAVADRERRAFARTDQEIVLAGEQERERERATKPGQRPPRPPSDGERPFFISCVTRCATTSVSVSEPNLAPFFVSSSRSS